MEKNTFQLIQKPLRLFFEKKVIKPIKKDDKIYQGPKIPGHFQKHPIITYSQAEIKMELAKYPGLLKTLSHAYQYQITVTSNDTEKDYWFCRETKYSVSLLKYFNEQGWQVDCQEKPFQIF